MGQGVGAAVPASEPYLLCRFPVRTKSGSLQMTCSRGSRAVSRGGPGLSRGTGGGF